MPHPAAPSSSSDAPAVPRPTESLEDRVRGGRALAEIAGWPPYCPDPACGPRPGVPFGQCAGRLRPVEPGRPRTHPGCLLICWLAHHDPDRLSFRDILAFDHFRFGPEAAGGDGPLASGAIGLAEMAEGWGPVEAELDWDENPVSEGLRCLDPDWSPDGEGAAG